jgi:putative phosphonate catabolism associated alcohol dehydrogenase
MNHSTNSTGRYQVFQAPGIPLGVQESPLPFLQTGELLIENEYVTLCRSDLNTFCGKRTEKSPTILGHEIVGRVVEQGPYAPQTDLRGEPIEMGDRLTWGIYASDPTSPLAKKGIPQKGRGLFKYGHEKIEEAANFHGGLASHTQLRAHTPLVKISEEVPLSVAALINCAVATVAGSLRIAGDLANQRVLVSGVGMLGVTACAMAKVAGAKEVIAVDVNPGRLELAQDFGATKGLLPDDAYNQRGLVDVVLEYSGASTAMAESLKWLAIGGTAVWVGGTFPQPALPIDPEQIIRNLSTIRGLHNYNAQDLVQGVNFIEQHHQTFPFAQLVHEMQNLESSQQAFEYALEHNPLRVGIRL